jgi:hypothetical protein
VAKKASRKSRSRKLLLQPVYPHRIEIWIHALRSGVKAVDALSTALHEQLGPDWNRQQVTVEQADAFFEQARRWIRASKEAVR